VDIPGPDLTHLSKENGGRFPFQEVYDVIDGRKLAAAPNERWPPAHAAQSAAGLMAERNRAGRSGQFVMLPVTPNILDRIELARQPLDGEPTRAARR